MAIQIGGTIGGENNNGTLLVDDLKTDQIIIKGSVEITGTLKLSGAPVSVVYNTSCSSSDYGLISSCTNGADDVLCACVQRGTNYLWRLITN